MHISHSVCVEANEVHRLLDLENITLCVHHPVQTQGRSPAETVILAHAQLMLAICFVPMLSPAI